MLQPIQANIMLSLAWLKRKKGEAEIRNFRMDLDFSSRGGGILPYKSDGGARGVHMKTSGKNDFPFSLELTSSTIGLHIGKSCFGVFSKFKCELAVYIQEVYEMRLVAMATEAVFLHFLSFLWPCVPPRIFKTLFLKM